MSNSCEPETSEAPRRRGRKFTFGLKGLLAFVVVISAALLAVGYWLGYMPGTLQTKVNGLRVEAWGTGVLTNRYSSGAVQSRHWFRAGRHLKSEWYGPDGTTIATTTIEKGLPAKFYQLRDDGTVSDEFFLLDGVPDGRWLHYNEAGKVTRIDTLLGGLIIKREEVNQEIK